MVLGWHTNQVTGSMPHFSTAYKLVILLHLLTLICLSKRCNLSIIVLTNPPVLVLVLQVLICPHWYHVISVWKPRFCFNTVLTHLHSAKKWYRNRIKINSHCFSHSFSILTSFKPALTSPSIQSWLYLWNLGLTAQCFFLFFCFVLCAFSDEFYINYQCKTKATVHSLETSWSCKSIL